MGRGKVGTMNILLLGSGGREHALAWKMAASPLTDRLYCAPGNAGIARDAECIALDIDDHAAVIAFCKSHDVDFVVVGPEGPLCAGIVDDLEAAAAMTRHLLSLGHRDIGFIVGAPNQTVSAQRQAGFEKALKEAGLTVHPEWVKQGSFTYRSGLVAAEQILDSARHPTAIFASNDDMAAAAIAVAHRLNLDVPKDLTIVGFDDTPLATTIWPALTTVRQPVAAMARKAVELLMEEIRLRRLGETLGPTQHFMNFTLVKRESSASL